MAFTSGKVPNHYVKTSANSLNIFSFKMIASILKVHVGRIYNIVHVLEGAKYIEPIIYKETNIIIIITSSYLAYGR